MVDKPADKHGGGLDSEGSSKKQKNEHGGYNVAQNMKKKL